MKSLQSGCASLLGLLLVGGAFRIISITEGQSALVRMKTFLIEDLIITRREPNRPQLACEIRRLKRWTQIYLFFRFTLEEGK